MGIITIRYNTLLLPSSVSSFLGLDLGVGAGKVLAEVEEW
jgi:hypothetical protein